MGLRAIVHIFGSEEALEVARSAIRKFRRDEPPGGHVYDYDSAPVENPLDDPYGKGCYGYKALKITYQHNGAIREANKAVAEYYKRSFKHLLNEDGSLADGADTASLDPGTLQYLERSRHLLTKNDERPQNQDPRPSGPTEPNEEPPAPSESPSSVTPEPGEEPPRPRRRKIRRIIHLGPPSEEDPPDDYPRPRGDPDEIRIPLRDVVRYTAGPL